jgi:hypothetical protein
LDVRFGVVQKKKIWIFTYPLYAQSEADVSQPSAATVVDGLAETMDKEGVGRGVATMALRARSVGQKISIAVSAARASGVRVRRAID